MYFLRTSSRYVEKTTPVYAEDAEVELFDKKKESPTETKVLVGFPINEFLLFLYAPWQYCRGFLFMLQDIDQFLRCKLSQMLFRI